MQTSRPRCSRRESCTACSAPSTLRARTNNVLRRVATQLSFPTTIIWLQRDDRRYRAQCDKLAADRTISDSIAVLAKLAASIVLDVRSLFACSALERSLKCCHVGLFCTTQRAQYSSHTWVRTLYVLQVRIINIFRPSERNTGRHNPMSQSHTRETAVSTVSQLSMKHVATVNV